MARAKGEWQQLEVKQAPGAEAFFIVRHREGWFRMPADARLDEVLAGVAAGWQDATRYRPGRTTVTVSGAGLTELRLQLQAAEERADNAERHLAYERASRVQVQRERDQLRRRYS